MMTVLVFISVLVKLIQQMRSPSSLLSGDDISWQFPTRITVEVGLEEGSGFRLSQRGCSKHREQHGRNGQLGVRGWPGHWCGGLVREKS